jgi:hypothetical protein
MLEARTIIWIAETIRSEHKTAIDFLNKNLKDSLEIYAIELSLIKIDNSLPAINFDTICSPIEGHPYFKNQVNETTERYERYRVFFQSLLDTLRVNHKFTKAMKGQPQNWYTFSSEYSKFFKYSASFTYGEKFRTEIYIDSGDSEKNDSLYNFLYDRKDEIEVKYGMSLTWEKLENKRANRISAYTDGSIDDETERIELLVQWAVKNLLQMKKVFPKYIQEWLNQ